MEQAPKGRSGEETRQAALSVALRLFQSKGFGSAPLSAIAEELSITKAALYYYFRSKAELAQAVCEPFLGEVAALIERARTEEFEAEVLLSELLAVLVRHHDVAVLLQTDVSVRAVPEPARFDGYLEEIRSLLAASPEPEADVRASSALGAILRPLVAFDAAIVRRNTDAIRGSAVAVLRTTPRP